MLTVIKLIEFLKKILSTVRKNRLDLELLFLFVKKEQSRLKYPLFWNALDTYMYVIMRGKHVCQSVTWTDYILIFPDKLKLDESMGFRNIYCFILPLLVAFNFLYHSDWNLISAIKIQRKYTYVWK